MNKIEIVYSDHIKRCKNPSMFKAYTGYLHLKRIALWLKSTRKIYITCNEEKLVCVSIHKNYIFVALLPEVSTDYTKNCYIQRW